MKKLLSSKKWTEPQREWLDRISKQLKVETIVDREAIQEVARDMVSVRTGTVDYSEKRYPGW